MNSTHNTGIQGGRVRWALPQTAQSATAANLLGALWGLASWRAVEQGGQGEWRVLAWRYLARQAKVSRAYVAREMRAWERAGLIEVERRRAPNGARLANAYRFTRARLDAWFKRHNTPNPLDTPPKIEARTPAAPTHTQGREAQDGGLHAEGGGGTRRSSQRGESAPARGAAHSLIKHTPRQEEPSPAWRTKPLTGGEPLSALASTMWERLKSALETHFGVEGRALAHELAWRYAAMLDSADATQWKPYLAYYHGRLRRLHEGRGLPYDPQKFT